MVWSAVGGSVRLGGCVGGPGCGRCSEPGGCGGVNIAAFRRGSVLRVANDSARWSVSPGGVVIDDGPACRGLRAYAAPGARRARRCRAGDGAGAGGGGSDLLGSPVRWRAAGWLCCWCAAGHWSAGQPATFLSVWNAVAVRPGSAAVSRFRGFWSFILFVLAGARLPACCGRWLRDLPDFA